MYFIGAYFILLVCIAVYDLLHRADYTDLVVGGRKQTFFPLYCSLMATMLGASATMGVAARAEKIGFPAFWWLGAGSAGLALQAVFLSRRIRKLSVNTLPEVAGKLVGPFGRTCTAGVIAVSWVGIIAAQLIAAAQFLHSFTGGISQSRMTVAVAAVVILYTAAGGQLSVIKTDFFQFLILLISLVACAGYLYFCAPWNGPKPVIALTGTNFGAGAVCSQILIVGGAFFLGPDILSRNFAARSAKTAFRVAGAAAISLPLLSIIIVFCGMWAGVNAPGAENPFLRLVHNVLPNYLGLILSLGLVSALLSSADTCLINASAILCNDVFKKSSTRLLRAITVIIGCAALLIALYKPDIISLLLSAYSVYTPGVVMPLTIAVIAHRRFEIRKTVWYAALATGSLCGLAGEFADVETSNWALAGLAVSSVLAVLSLRSGHRKQEV